MRKNVTHITQATLRELFSYDSETGLFTWKVAIGSRNGHVAGTTIPAGYVKIQIYGVRYFAHRLAWLYCHGETPDCDIDHKNMIRNDNRICNLRKATRSQNLINSKVRKDNKCGIRGVYKEGRRWRAAISISGKQTRIGSFSSKEEAAHAYKAASVLHHGDFSRHSQ